MRASGWKKIAGKQTNLGRGEISHTTAEEQYINIAMLKHHNSISKIREIPDLKWNGCTPSLQKSPKSMSSMMVWKMILTLSKVCTVI